VCVCVFAGVCVGFPFCMILAMCLFFSSPINTKICSSPTYSRRKKELGP
jgi:hypothetical protein